MAKLVYDKSGRLLFTKEMKKEYTILMPMMLPAHFTLMRNAFRLDGYHMELLTTNNRNIVEEGLRNVHNDSCYPALLVIGQFLDALESGRYDINKVALVITQTGGGCRASNYIHLLRKALERAGYPQVPVISLNLSGLEKNPGFKLNYNLGRRIVYAMLYGDLLTLLANQCHPYEVKKGDTDRLLDGWISRLTEEYKQPKNLKYKHVRANMDRICADFAALPQQGPEKIRVGVVGEIYIKYAPLGNNNLEQFLLSEGVEPVVPGLLDFVIFKVDNRVVDPVLYGGHHLKHAVSSLLERILKDRQRELIETVRRYPRFRPPETFDHIKELVRGYLGYGNKMGEGWLLTGEMLELVHSGTPNIICAQPFGCLPNHVVGKGMIRAIRERNPGANIVAIDYDPGATRINQENRIKLMLANARIALAQQKSAQTAPAAASVEPVAVQ